MKVLRASSLLLSVLVLSSSALAQPAAAPAEPVLQVMPAGALGYVVINNGKTTADHVDKFLADTGLAEMIFNGQPQSVLDLIRKEAKLGEGFNPNGGAAVVLLDPKPFNYDLIEAFMHKKGTAAEGEPATQPAEQKPPLVIFIAASSVEELFSNYPMTKGEKYTVVKLRMGETYATKVGGYVVFSPEQRYLDAALSAPAKAASEWSDYDSGVMAKSDLAARVNVQVAMPLIERGIAALEKKIGQKSAEPGMSKFLASILKFYVNIIKQMDSLTVAAHIADDGVLVDAMLSFQPNSEVGKMMAAVKGTAPAKMVDRLPDLPYVLAAGGGRANTEVSPEETRMQQDVLKDIFDAIPDSTLSADMKARIQKLVVDLSRNVNMMQMSLGGAAADTGIFSLTAVMGCKDANAVKGMLADGAGIGEDLINKFIDRAMGSSMPPGEATTGPSQNAMKLTMKYEKNVGEAGGVSLDAIVIDHPMLAMMRQSGPGQLSMFLGEEQIRLLVAAPDNNTVVITFGGGVPLMTEALKAAKGNGPIASAPETAAALKHLPQDSVGLILLNGGNAFTVAGKIAQTLMGTELPFTITTKTPIAIGVGIKGSTEHLTLFVPTALVKEGVGVYQKLRTPTAKAAPAPGAAPSGAKDF